MDENDIINIIYNIIFLIKKDHYFKIASAVVQVRHRLTFGGHIVNLHEIFIEKIN